MSANHKSIAIENYPFLNSELYEKHIEDNIKVMSALKNADDNPAVEREIEHFIYFSNTLDEDAFVTEIDKMGYQYEYAEQRPGVVIKTTLAIDEIELHTITLKIHNISVKYTGEYDGWGSPVCK